MNSQVSERFRDSDDPTGLLPYSPKLFLTTDDSQLQLKIETTAKDGMKVLKMLLFVNLNKYLQMPLNFSD